MESLVWTVKAEFDYTWVGLSGPSLAAAMKQVLFAAHEPPDEAAVIKICRRQCLVRRCEKTWRMSRTIKYVISGSSWHAWPSYWLNYYPSPTAEGYWFDGFRTEGMFVHPSVRHYVRPSVRHIFFSVRSHNFLIPEQNLIVLTHNTPWGKGFTTQY